MARQRDRSPWTSLTTGQTLILAEAEKDPSVYGMDTISAYATLSQDFAIRAARLLVMNDLRGALDAAEISRVCDQMSSHARQAQEEAAARRLAYLEQLRNDPRGYMVAIPGTKRRVRVRPGEQPPPDADPTPLPLPVRRESERTGRRLQGPPNRTHRFGADDTERVDT